jgi:ribosomal protein S18 acetylase RimI-like enzyme
MPFTVRVLGSAEGALLGNVVTGVFDNPIDPRWSAEFFADPRHHLAVAVDDETTQVVGMASGVHYVHPDKPPELWINEVGVAPAYQGRGIGRRVVAALLDHARSLGCSEAWLLTSDDNTAARRMYAAAGGVEDEERQVMVAFRLGDHTQP